MKMRTVAIAVLIVFVLAAVAIAADQRAAGAGMKNRRPMARIAKQLGLTPEQVSQIGDIVKKFHADVQKIAKGNAPEEEKQTKIKALKELKDKAADAIMALLNAEQQEKAKKMNLTEMLLSPRRGEMALMRILAQLNLRDDQKAAIKDIMKASEEKAKAIREDPKLDEATKRTNLEEIRKATLEEIKTKLDPDQLKKLEDLLAKRPKPGEKGTK